MQRKFVLIGLPGVGKSTLTNKFLEALMARGVSCNLLSTDVLVRSRFKKDDPVIMQFEKLKCIKIPEQVFSSSHPTREFVKIFGEEPLYRDLEEALIVDIIKKLSSNDWLDLGGKAPLRRNTLFSLNDKKIIPIFLYAEASTIIERLKKDNGWKNRTNYALEGEGRWRLLAEAHRKERLSKYIDAASIIIAVDSTDTGGEQKNPDDLVSEIAYRMKEFEIVTCERKNCFTARY